MAATDCRDRIPAVARQGCYPDLSKGEDLAPGPPITPPVAVGAGFPRQAAPRDKLGTIGAGQPRR